jgi:hypothetical protein
MQPPHRWRNDRKRANQRLQGYFGKLLVLIGSMGTHWLRTQGRIQAPRTGAFAGPDGVEELAQGQIYFSILMLYHWIGLNRT